MRLHQKVVSALLCASLTLSLFAVPAVASAEEQNTPVINQQSSRPSYENYEFTEDFEGDLSKWETHTFKENFVSDFQITADPDDPANNVLFFTQQSVVLTPKDAYWPEDGQMLTATFKMRCTNDNVPGVNVVCSFKDDENYMGYYPSHSWGGKIGFFAKFGGYIGGEDLRAGGAPVIQDFDILNWFDVSIAFSDNAFSITFTDQHDNVFVMRSGKTIVDGKFAVGLVYRYLSTFYNTQTKYPYYIDNINIRFSKLSIDSDIDQKDVIVYYAGNSVYEPGDLISITGEQLGKTVGSVSILKLQDGAISTNANDAGYINETDYEYYKEDNIDWATLQANAVAGTERQLDILQKSNLGIKVSIPDDGEYAQRGMYAIKLSAAAEGGKDAIVIVNNPYISLLLHDDGDAATPNGWLRIGGYNLSIQNDKSKVNAIIIDGNGNRTFVDSNCITVQTSDTNEDPDDDRSNDYYVKVDMNNLAPGDYQIMLHNGYGGDLGWSMPFDFTVKEESAAAAWRDNAFFNVKDFGAVGDSNHNDTAAIIQALNAAYLAGGGTVYLPAGFYLVTDTLYIPNNVSLIGDGKYETAIFFYDNNWVETPEAMIIFETNVEIADMYFYGGVAPVLFKQNEDATEAGGYIYFENVRTLFDASEGCSSGRGMLMEGYTAATAQLYLKEHGGTGDPLVGAKSKGFATLHVAGMKGSAEKLSNYIKIVNTDFFKAGLLPGNSCNLDVHADYLYIDDVSWSRWSKVMAIKSGFIIGTEWQNGCLNYQANIFFLNCSAGNITANNREVLIPDGAPKYNNQIIQDLNEANVVAEVLAEERTKLSAANYQKLCNYISANQGRVFRCLTAQLNYSTETANMVFVVDGQGAGQARFIENSILTCGGYSYFTVANEFTVNPNRNSRVFIYGRRCRTFIVNSYFYNSSTVGIYGTEIDFVADGVHLDEMGSGISFTPNQGVNWYITERNTVSENIIIGHTDVMHHNGGAFSYGSNTGSPLAYLGIRLYGNTVGQGGFYGSVLCSRPNRKEVIIENVVFYSDDGKGFHNFSLGGEGVYFRNNKQYDRTGNPATLTTAYDEALIKAFRNSAVNRYGSYEFMCDEYRSTQDAKRYCGDVNNDGLINLKDAQIIRDYLAGKISEEEMKTQYGNTVMQYADCDKYAGVDSRDVFEIYEYVRDPDGYRGKVGTDQTGSGTVVEEYEPTHKNDDIGLDYAGVEEDGTDPNAFGLDYTNVADED